jgi:hypothetical protein
MTDEHGRLILMGSAALPGFFPPVNIGGEVYVDAGVLGYTRLAPALDAGADTLHVIYLDPDVENIPVAALQSTLDTLYRLFVVQWADNIDSSVEAVQRVNKAVLAVEALLRDANLSGTAAASFLKDLLPPRRSGGGHAAGADGRASELRQVSVHLYHPREDPGPLGFLDLERDRVEALIARGFDDAVAHDCGASRCVLTDTTERARSAA